MRGIPIGCTSKNAYGARCVAARGGVCSHPCTGLVHSPCRLRALPTTMGARSRMCNAEWPERCARLSPHIKQVRGSSRVQRGVLPGVVRTARRVLPVLPPRHRRALGKRQRMSPDTLTDGIEYRARPAAPWECCRDATVRGADAACVAANDGAMSGSLLPRADRSAGIRSSRGGRRVDPSDRYSGGDCRRSAARLSPGLHSPLTRYAVKPLTLKQAFPALTD